MENNKVAYRSIVKATSIFGGVQVIQILVTIIRGKLVAVLLGTVGMGINNLLLSAVNIITQIAGLGISFSAVRDISQANESQDTERIGKTFKTVRTWLLISAALGVVVIVALSSTLSMFSFGSTEYTWSFVWLAVVVALTIVNNGNIALLQGMRRLRLVARATLFGAVLGLVSAIPLYWLYGVEGIVPALIISAVTTCCASWYFVRKVDVPKVELPVQTAINQGRDMIKLGVVSMVAGLLGALTIYIINSFISNYGTLSDVGLYSSAISISNQYIGVLFTAMAVDYFPRLSVVCNDRIATNDIVNKQGEIVMLIAAPLLILMMCTAPLLIRILLSPEFEVIKDFICWVAFGMFFKAVSYPLGYIAFAKGDRKIYFWLEGVAGNALMLSFNILGYVLGGLTGMAMSFVLLYMVFLVVYSVISYRRYGFRFEKAYLRMMSILITATLSVFLITQFLSEGSVYLFGGIAFLLIGFYCYKELNKRIGIRELVMSRFKK